jgi:AcrR family transcriptional regulator
MRSRDPDLNAARRNAILKAASDCFVERGFNATSMKEICVAATMSPGTLYHYFRSKAEIIIGIIEAERRDTAEMLAGIDKADDVLLALFEAFEAIANLVTERDLVLHAEVAAEVLRQPELKRAAIAADLQALEQLSAAIRKGQDADQLDAKLDPTRSARMILALVDGLLTLAALHGLSVISEQLPALRQAVARMLVSPEDAR